MNFPTDEVLGTTTNFRKRAKNSSAWVCVALGNVTAHSYNDGRSNALKSILKCYDVLFDIDSSLLNSQMILPWGPSSLTRFRTMAPDRTPHVSSLLFEFIQLHTSCHFGRARSKADSHSSGMFQSCIRRSRSYFGISSRYLRVLWFILSGERNNYS